VNIIDFLLQNEEELKEYFERAKVNHNKTEIKFGISHLNVSMVFYITGEHDKSIISFQDKVKALFNTNTDITEVNDFINKLDTPYKFEKESPFLKLKDEPLLHAFQVTVRKVKAPK